VGAYGVLAHVYEPLDDARGCHLVRTHDTQWIALLRRGGCSFAQKVYTMQQSGAIAVIVGDRDTTEWITMSSEGW
jgi:E3 ubiquitin-protein ligase RNF13